MVVFSGAALAGLCASGWCFGLMMWRPEQCTFELCATKTLVALCLAASSALAFVLTACAGAAWWLVTRRHPEEP